MTLAYNNLDKIRFEDITYQYKWNPRLNLDICANVSNLRPIK